MLNLELWNTQRKKMKLTLADIAKISNISISTIKDIFRGATADPRLETVQAIERALGLSPEWTPEEIAQGVGNHAVVLSDEDSYRLDVLARAEETLGKPYVDGVMQLIEFNIKSTKKDKKT